MDTRQARINTQPMFDVLSMAKHREASGHYVARMEIGDTPGFRNLAIHELIEKCSSSAYRYSPSRGEKVLIDKVIQTQWPNALEDNVVIGPANFLITAALASKTSPGDVVLLPDPGFASYKLAADFLGLRIIYYSVYKNNVPVFPNLAELVLNFQVRPKVIVVNNPSNPLGIAFGKNVVFQSLKNLPSLGVEIIFDETYVNLIYDNTEVAVEQIPGTRIRSFSKEHCAPGLRVGYAVGDKSAAKTMSDLMSMSISCVPQFIQFAVSEYLGSPDAAEFTIQLKAEMSRRLDYLAENTPGGALQIKPNAAFYALIDTGLRGGDAAFPFLLEQNVSTCPGSKFGENSKNTVRVSLAGSGESFEKDVEMLSSALKLWMNS
jgi:aspartate/methionine/tyrosine aminotransferase